MAPSLCMVQLIFKVPKRAKGAWVTTCKLEASPLWVVPLFFRQTHCNISDELLVHQTPMKRSTAITILTMIRIQIIVTTEIIYVDQQRAAIYFCSGTGGRTLLGAKLKSLGGPPPLRPGRTLLRRDTLAVFSRQRTGPMVAVR